MKLSLRVVQQLEEAHGSLYKIAEALLDKTLAAAEIESILKKLCCHDHRDMPGEERLMQILLDILGPFEKMGAVVADNGAKRLDVKNIRMFFMGVLGWPPSVVMDDADLRDLADAFEGYARFYGPACKLPPSPHFLDEMIKKFPDPGREV